MEKSPDDGAHGAVLRYVYKGESLRNGRVLHISTASPSAASGAELLDALASPMANVDVSRWVPFYYSRRLEGWERLGTHSEVPLPQPTADAPLPRIELMLEQPQRSLSQVRAEADASGGAERVHQASGPPQPAVGAAAALGDASALEALAAAAAGGRASESEGFFGIGVHNSKSVENVGTLWRSAFMLGASYLFTIGGRNAWEKTADTYKSWRRVPAFRYDDWAAFCASAPFSTEWVAVEQGGTPLEQFRHPERALYVLGAEDAGLPAAVVRACAHCVSLDGVRAASYNVAVAGTLVMYDRMQKRGACTS